MKSVRNYQPIIIVTKDKTSERWDNDECRGYNWDLLFEGRAVDREQPLCRKYAPLKEIHRKEATWGDTQRQFIGIRACILEHKQQ